jgi:nitrite reductase (NO-forming)
VAGRDRSWVAVAAAQVTLLSWLVLLLGADLLGAAAPAPCARAASPWGAASLGVLGFGVPVVLGMFPRLAPGLLGLPRAPGRMPLACAAVGALMSACGLAWAALGEAALVGLQGALASCGAVLLFLTLASARRSRAGGLKVAAPSPRLALPGNLLLGSAVLYLGSGGALLALVALAPQAALDLGLSPSPAWPLHLVTAGFLANAVFGVGTRMFAAFASAQAPPRAVWVVALAGAAAPAGIASGLSRYSYTEVAASGAVALVAAVTFAAVVIHLWRRQSRRQRAAWYLLVAASLSLVAGEALGALFGAYPAYLSMAAVHAQINVLGFVGLTVFGVLFLLSGGGAARPDFLDPGISIAFLWPAALALRAVATVAGTEWGATIADAVLVASYLVAARSSHPARPRPGAAPQPPE